MKQQKSRSASTIESLREELVSANHSLIRLHDEYESKLDGLSKESLREMELMRTMYESKLTSYEEMLKPGVLEKQLRDEMKELTIYYETELTEKDKRRVEKISSLTEDSARKLERQRDTIDRKNENSARKLQLSHESNLADTTDFFERSISELEDKLEVSVILRRSTETSKLLNVNNNPNNPNPTITLQSNDRTRGRSTQI